MPSKPMLNKRSILRIGRSLSRGEPMVKGPIRWAIRQDEDGWMIVFSGAINGAIHPQSFCEMIIEELNDGTNCAHKYTAAGDDFG